MKIDLKELKEELQKRPGTDRARQSIYVSTPVWEEFKKVCKPVSASKILENWMRAAIEESKRKK